MIYLKFGSLLGDVQEAGHTNWIELLSVNWGLVRPVSNPAGSAAGRVLSAPRLAELSVCKHEDAGTIPLIQEALVGLACDAQIDFCRTGAGDASVYYSITMNGTLITAFTQSGTGERPQESLTFNFTKISFSGTQMDADGSSASPSSYSWDVSGNAPA
jgi:type VI secretion system secreted protein Hcp